MALQPQTVCAIVEGGELQVNRQVDLGRLTGSK